MLKFYMIGFFISCLLIVLVNNEVLSFLLIFPAVTFIILAFKQDEKDKTEQKGTTLINFRNLMIENKFDSSNYMVDKDGKNGLAIDENNKKLAIYDNQKNFHLLNFKDVLEVQLIENGETITKTSRGSQLGGALIGGMIAGGVGAIIGGLSGEQTTNQSINSIKIDIVVDDLTKPVYSVYFFDNSLSIEKNDKQYNELSEVINHWYRLISVIVKRNENNKETEASL